MSGIFDLEQNIMKCWSVVDDIDVFLERIDQKELEQLLTTITEVNAIEDWKNV